MLHIYHDLCLDFQRPEFPQLLRMRDGGNGLHQHITVHLFRNGMPEVISGAAFSLHWQKGDNTLEDGELDAVCNEHKVTFELPRGILVGNPEVTVWLHIQKDDAVLHAFPFRLYVYQMLGSDEVISE